MTLTEYFISNVQLQKEWASDKNAVTPDELTPYTRLKVWWRCDRGHEWQAALDSRVVLDRKCPYCSNQAVLPGENDMEATAPEMRKLWHPTRNTDLQPSDIIPRSRKTAWSLCER